MNDNDQTYYGGAGTCGPSSKPARLAYGVDEAAQLTGLGRTTLYGLIARGALPSVKIGNRRIIRSADLDTLLRGARKEVA